MFKKIQYIYDYSDIYTFSDRFRKSKNISAIQMDLFSEYPMILDQIACFLDFVHLDYGNLYLLTFKTIGNHFNKVDVYKKLWSNYPGTDNILKGDELRYDFKSGIIYASIAKIDDLNLKLCVDILVKYPLTSAIIYSDKILIEYIFVKEIFDGFFIPLLDTIDNPEIIQLDFEYLIKCFCKKDNGVIRYANDGDEQEIAFFVNRNSKFNIFIKYNL